MYFGFISLYKYGNYFSCYLYIFCGNKKYTLKCKTVTPNNDWFM